MIYDKITCKYAGFIDYRNLSVENGEEYASEVLVFMLTGLKTYWRCPVDYCLTNKCNSEIQTSLLKNCLSLAADYGLRVLSVTCDETSTNLTMLILLGCKFTNSFETIPPLPSTSWFSLNNSKTLRAVTLEFCSIQ